MDDIDLNLLITLSAISVTEEDFEEVTFVTYEVVTEPSTVSKKTTASTTTTTLTTTASATATTSAHVTQVSKVIAKPGKGLKAVDTKHA